MRVWFVAVLFVCIGAFSAQAQQVLTPREFGDAAIALIQHNAPQAQIERRDDLAIFVRGATDDGEYVMNLDNAYREYQANPATLTDILDRWARIASQGPEYAQMRERIVTVLRPRAMIDEFEAQSAAIRSANDSPPSSLVWRPFAGDLVEVVVFDSAETIQYAMLETLEQIDITPETAWTIAPTNLPARLGELDVQGIGGTQHLIYITGGNGLAPSPLADSDFCATEQGPTFIFLLVDRNGYIAADRTKSAAVSEFRALYEQIMREGGSMSSTPIACQGGRMHAVTFTD
ncbi:MAG: hypothetical protein R3C27_15545 [Hyphomonadaceae bacterium]